MPAARFPPFFGVEKENQSLQPFVPAPGEIVGREGVGYLLQCLRIAASAEGIAALLETDAGLLHLVGEPMMLINPKISLRPGSVEERPDASVQTEAFMVNLQGSDT